MNGEDDGFVIVTKKKKNKMQRGIAKWSDGKLQLTEKQKKNVLKSIDAFAPSSSIDNQSIAINKIVENINEYRKEIEDTVFFTTMIDILKQRPSFSKMICYGIGCIHDSAISQYQYACALSIYEQFQISTPMEIFDPVMDLMDVHIVSKFKTKVLCTNEVGRRAIDSSTLFFMPHCGFGLYNGVIWSNWGENLQHVTIIGNLFSSYDQLIMEEEKRIDPSNCILPILPYMNEYPLVSDVKKLSTITNRLHYDSFHSTAILFMNESQYQQGKKDGLWEKRPEEPMVNKDVSVEVNEEVIEYLKKQEDDYQIWDHLMNCNDCDFSSLIPTKTKYPDYSKQINNQNQKKQIVYVYNDTGCCAECVSMTLYSFSKLLPSSLYDIQTIDSDKLVSTEWEKDCCLLIFPGGAANPYQMKLGEEEGNKGNARIKKYVEEGGNYLGFCAGAYYGCSSILFDKIMNRSYDLAFFKGKGIGPAMKGFDYYSTEGTHAVTFSYSLKNQQYKAKAFFKGGPYFIPTEENTCIEIAHFVEQPDLVCEANSLGCIECEVGKGKCILCAFHIEYDPWMLKQGIGIDDVLEELREEEGNNNRIRFFYSLLERFHLVEDDYSFLD